MIGTLYTRFVRPVIVSVGVILVLAMGSGVHTTAALAPDETMIIASGEGEQTQIVLENPLVDGLTVEQRVAKVRNYFAQYNLPAADYADEMVKAADANGIDWKLIPSIAMIESTGFKFAHKENHNGLGWGNGHLKFASYEESIARVSSHLGGHEPKTERYYKEKDLDGILKSYNSEIPTYSTKIKNVMERISQTPV